MLLVGKGRQIVQVGHAGCDRNHIPSLFVYACVWSCDSRLSPHAHLMEVLLAVSGLGVTCTAALEEVATMTPRCMCPAHPSKHMGLVHAST